MQTTLQKWGNSHGLRIPKAVLESIGLEVGAEVLIEVSEDSRNIVVSPVIDSRPVRGRHRIEDLVLASPKKAFNGEHEWGAAVGGEVW